MYYNCISITPFFKYKIFLHINAKVKTINNSYCWRLGKLERFFLKCKIGPKKDFPKLNPYGNKVEVKNLEGRFLILRRHPLRLIFQQLIPHKIKSIIFIKKK